MNIITYVQGFANSKNVLAEFITTVCFDEKATEKYENWNLVYPQIYNKDEAYEWILNNRRATISSTFLPINKWENNEVFRITKKYLNSFSDKQYKAEEFIILQEYIDKIGDIIRIPLENKVNPLIDAKCIIHKINDLGSVDINLKYNTDLISLEMDEFFIDYNDNYIYFNIDNFNFNNFNKFIINLEYRILPLIEIPLTKNIYNDSAIKLTIKNSKNIFYKNNNLKNLNILEFFPDILNSKLILLKDTLKLDENEEIIFVISYQTYSDVPITWYVDFNYPEKLDRTRENNNYFEWTFGDKINEYYHVINSKVNPPILRCYWHTVNKLKVQSTDWLPIEYFISWDDSAISFVMCEDPITDIDITMHAFNYIGSLESIKNADYDDIKGNFGSCGSYDINVEDMKGRVDDVNKNNFKVNITFISRYYDSYFNQTREINLLKTKNVRLGNYIVDLDMIDNRNLLQDKIQQFIIGDSYVKYSEPSKIKNTFNNQPISRYNIHRKNPISKFTLQKDTKILYKGKERILKEDCLVEFNSIQNVTILYNTYITFINSNISVINLDTNIIGTLLIGTSVLLKNNFTATINTDGFIILPPNIEFIFNGTKYKTINQSEIYVDIFNINGNAFVTLKNDTNILNKNDIIKEEIILKDEIIEIITSYTPIKFNLIDEYIVEFQYRDPFKGTMNYDFPTKWFDGISRPKDFYDFSESTPLLLPIKEEKMVDNSLFNGKTTISSRINELPKGKSPVLDRISLSKELNNNYHKNITTAPELITNIKTGESWILRETNVLDGVEKTDNSITNICMYPYQVYVGNFCYEKRTPQKATIKLDGIKDSELLRFVITDENNKVLLDFGHNGSYKNLYVTYNSDNGMTLNVNIEESFSDEIVYVKMYKLSNYLVDGSGVKIESVKKPPGCTCTNIKILGPEDPGYPNRPGEFNRFTIYKPDPDKNNELSWASDHSAGGCGFNVTINKIEDIYPIDVKLFYNYLDDYNEFITHLRNTKASLGETVTSSVLWSYPAHSRIYESELIQQAFNKGIVTPVNKDSDIYYSQIPLYKVDESKKDEVITGITFMEVRLNDLNKTFIPKILNISNTSHNWV